MHIAGERYALRSLSFKTLRRLCVVICHPEQGFNIKHVYSSVKITS